MKYLISVVAYIFLFFASQNVFAGGTGDFRRSGDPIAGSYIVVFDAIAVTSTMSALGSLQSLAATKSSQVGGQLQFVYEDAVNGFSATMSEAAAIALSLDSSVAYVSEDSNAYTTSTASWGIDRLDQRQLPLDGQYLADYTGFGVTVYIIDSGIYTQHSAFGGRAVSGFDAINDGYTGDCLGHGTHVAGTVGGTGFGVAPNVTLVAVRVFDCYGHGSASQIIAGVNWVTKNHPSGNTAVANMSLTLHVGDATLDAAINNSVARGITYVIASGNDSASTVATSMASPHVAGIAAIYLQQNPNLSPAALKQQLLANASTPAYVGSSIVPFAYSRNVPADVMITQSSSTSISNQPYSVIWSSQHADWCAFERRGLYQPSFLTISSSLNGQQSFFDYPDTYTFQIRCHGSTGEIAATVTHTVVPAVTSSISQSVTTTVSNSPYVVSWNSANATSCSVDASRNGEVPIVIFTGISGTQTVSPGVVGTHVWRNICQGPGGPVTSTFTHTVTPTVTSSISQSLTTTVSNSPYVITWSSTDATSCTLDASRNGEVPNAIFAGLSGTQTVSPAVVGTHVWRNICQGPGGPVTSTFTHTVTAN